MNILLLLWLGVGVVGIGSLFLSIWRLFNWPKPPPPNLYRRSRQEFRAAVDDERARVKRLLEDTQ